jgi:predicted nucleotidyltransferase component of viral defense system
MENSVSDPALSDSPDFDDAVRAAAEHHRMLPAFVLKDYWVTRVLRAIATDPGLEGRAVFKGGTSLSKGWRLIDRFSEDIDLLLTGPTWGPMPDVDSERQRQFRALRACIEGATPLRLPAQASLSRDEWNFNYFRGNTHCNLRYSLPGRRASAAGPATDWILVESGYRGGAHPHVSNMLTSLIAEFLEARPDAKGRFERYHADLAPFRMELLKPERTFAEKLLALHADMVDGVDGAHRVRTRHYYDVSQLFAKSDDVRESVRAGECVRLIRDAAAVSNEHFGTEFPESLDLASSPALNPTSDQERTLAAQYDGERALYYRAWVPFASILEQVHRIRDALAPGGA